MISSSSASNCAPCWRRARLLQALDLADDLVDVVAGARVHVHGVVAQRTHVVGIRALVHARERGRAPCSSGYARLYSRASSDGSIRSSRARRMILSSTSVIFCTHVTAKP